MLVCQPVLHLATVERVLLGRADPYGDQTEHVVGSQLHLPLDFRVGEQAASARPRGGSQHGGALAAGLGLECIPPGRI